MYKEIILALRSVGSIQFQWKDLVLYFDVYFGSAEFAAIHVAFCDQGVFKFMLKI